MTKLCNLFERIDFVCVWEAGRERERQKGSEKSSVSPDFKLKAFFMWALWFHFFANHKFYKQNLIQNRYLLSISKIKIEIHFFNFFNLKFLITLKPYWPIAIARFVIYIRWYCENKGLKCSFQGNENLKTNFPTKTFV